MDDALVEFDELPLLLAAVAFLALLLIGLSSRNHRSNHPVGRYLLSAVSAAYTSLMYYVLSQMPTYLSTMLSPNEECGDNGSDDNQEGTDKLTWVLFMLMLLSLIFVQFLKARADMAALAVTAVTSPVAGDDIDSLKIRPSIDNLISSFWVAALVIFSMLRCKNSALISDYMGYTILLIAPLWILGACRMVLRFAAFKMATGSFALGRNVQLIDNYMAWLQQRGFFHGHLIVTGERNEDVQESPTGYRIKLQDTRQGEQSVGGQGDGSLSLITVDRVVRSERSLGQDINDLCLSFALFKCLRRRFAGHQLSEAGSSWAFHFICDGLLGQISTEEDDIRRKEYKRIFQLIADELSFARDFYYSPLPVASLGTLPAALHFFLSFFISALFCILTLLLLALALFWPNPQAVIALVLSLVNASTEITEMVTSVRSNWTKISIIGHYIRCPQSCLHKIFSCLLGCRSGKHWKHLMGQTEMLKASRFCEQQSSSWAQACFNHLSHCLRRKRNHCKHKTKIPPGVEAAILDSFRSSEGQLRDGTATVRRRWQMCGHDADNIAWACYGGEVTTTTDLLLVWHIATSLFGIRYSSPRVAASTSSSATTDNMATAQTLSRYCAYLVAEAPDLLPDDSAWTKLRYKEVKKGIEEASKSSSHADVPESGVYAHLISSFSAESSVHELLKKGARLGEQLVKAAEESRTRGEDTVWKLLADFWSEMVLYLAPCDNVKRHLEALQRGGEFITLLWALLLHAGITSRPTRQVTEP